MITDAMVHVRGWLRQPVFGWSAAQSQIGAGRVERAVADRHTPRRPGAELLTELIWPPACAALGFQAITAKQLKAACHCASRNGALWAAEGSRPLRELVLGGVRWRSIRPVRKRKRR